MLGRSALLLFICSCTCLIYCGTQVVRNPGDQSVALANGPASQRQHVVSPRGWQAALSARERRHIKRLEKLDRRRDQSAAQADAYYMPAEVAVARELAEDAESTAESASEPRSHQLFPLLALATASFAAGLLLGYEVGRARSPTSFETPTASIPQALGTPHSQSRRADAQPASSTSCHPLEQAVSQASEKQELRLRARTAAAAIEASSEADPKLFASASRHSEVGAQEHQAEPVGTSQQGSREEGRDAESPCAGASDAGDAISGPASTDGGGAGRLTEDAAQSDHPIRSESRTAVARGVQGAQQAHSQAAPAAASHTPGTGSIDAWPEMREPVQTLSAASAAASVEPPACAESPVESMSAREQHISSSSAQQESIQREPDMLQSMQWVTSSTNGGSANSLSEPWNRATAFWAAFTGKLDVSCCTDFQRLCKCEQSAPVFAALCCWHACMLVCDSPHVKLGRHGTARKV